MDLESKNKFFLKCVGLPVVLLDKTIAKHHFGKFGRILSMHLRHKTKVCIVEYANEESLQQALANAGKFNGKSFIVTRGSKPTKRIAKKQLWTPNLEVQQELEAMSGVGVYKLGTKSKEKKTPKSLKATPQKKQFSKVSDQTTASNTSEQKELLKIVKQSAQTIEEKLRVLDARDKLIRLRTQKHGDLDFEPTIGTCPDMCPEKERLMREVQHQIALYEQEPSTKTLNPCLAVKQYSRSSADQEAPLPHELRSVDVLKMTMGYLMHKIIPLCDNQEVNLGEWYHFLWDRTRGIRKDITQQELCCHGSVELVEQCARFHIHCSARLVAEDPSVFDHKINTENLTKCLQTLKYMYHDLRCKNQSCLNEAEFRGYIILLNLNDGNFMWEVQQLRHEIQKSEQVQFALKVYSALDKNNYVKFFKLVKSTTYLNACILMRYFIQVRVKALQTLLKSFSPRGITQFPLEELKSILAFEGNASTRDFIEYYGLYMNDNSSRIYLDRSNFSIPELSYSLGRAMSIVESKRTLSIGEIICGGELPPKTFETHQPHSSFDEFGFINIKEHFGDIELSLLQSGDDEKPMEDKTVTNLKKIDSRSNSPFDAVDSSESKIIFGNKKSVFGRSEKSQDSIFGQRVPSEKIFGTSGENSEPPQPEETIPQKLPIFTQKSTSIFKPSQVVTNKSIFSNAIVSKPTGIFGQTVPQQSPVSSIFQHSSQNKTSIFKKSIVFAKVPQQTSWSNFPSELSSNVSTEKPKQGGFTFNLSPTKEKNAEQEALQKKRVFELQQREEENIRKKLLDEKLEKEMKAKEEERKKLEQRRLELEQERQKLIQQQFLQQQEIQKRLQEEQKHIENERKRLKELELQRQIELEKQKLAEHRKMQEIRKNVSVLLKNLIEQVEETDRIDRLNKIKEKIVNRKIKCFVMKWRNNIAKQKRKRKAIDDWPIWVNCVSHGEEAKELKQNNQKVVLMDMKRYKTGYATKINIRQTIHLQKINFRDILTILVKNNLVKSHIFWKVDICLPSIIESINNLKKVEENIYALLGIDSGTNASIETLKHFEKNITYCMKKYDQFCKDEITDGFIFINDVFTEEFYLKIKETIKNHKSHTLLPLAVIFPSSVYDEDKFDELIEDGIISNYAIFFNEFSSQNLGTLIRSSLSFLAKNVPKQPKVELDDFGSFLTKFLVEETWERINSFAEHNRPYGMCLTRPEVVFYLYEGIVSRLEKIIFNQELLECKDFPKIFLDHIRDKSPSSLPCDFKYFPTFWKNDSYNRKIRRVFDSLKSLDDLRINWPPKDIIELENTVSEICEKFKCPEKSCFRIIAAIVNKLEQLGNFSDIKYMMWTDVMKILTVEKLKTIDFTLREPFVSKSVFDRLFVVYYSEDLEKFNAEYWFYIDAVIQEEMDQDEIVIEESEDEVVYEEEEFDLEKTFENSACYDFGRDEVIEKGKSQMSEIREMLDDLEESMNIQKKIGSKIQETLALALNNAF